ncbi:MAG: glycosyltransferase family 39 protein [Saprospiraceae bacterium]
MNNKKRINYLIILLLLFAAVMGFRLMLLQLFQDRGLWRDESFLGINLIHKNYGDFLSTLDYEQIVPFLFLCIQKVIISIFGHEDITFRIFPFLIILATIPLVYQISKFLFKDIYYATLALSLFLLSPCLIYYASELKPYGTELFFSVLLIYIALIKKDRGIPLILAGCIGIFSANSSIIVLFSVALFILFEHFTNRNKINKTMFIGLASWLFFVILFYVQFVHNNPTEGFMDSWWEKNGGFLFSKQYTGDHLKRIIKLLDIFGSRYGFIFDNPTTVFRFLLVGKLYFGLLFLIGAIVSIMKKRYQSLFFCCFLPLLVHLVLNIFELYPIDKRLNLYQFPLVIFLILLGQQQLFALTRKNYTIKLLPVIFLIAIVIKHNRFPDNPDNTRAALSHLKKINAQEKEILLISFPAMMHYYRSQEKYEYLINGAKFHHARKLPFDIKELEGIKWLYISPEVSLEDRNSITNQLSIKEKIDNLRLFQLK